MRCGILISKTCWWLTCFNRKSALLCKHEEMSSNPQHMLIIPALGDGDSCPLYFCILTALSSPLKDTEGSSCCLRWGRKCDQWSWAGHTILDTQEGGPAARGRRRGSVLVLVRLVLLWFPHGSSHLCVMALRSDKKWDVETGYCYTGGLILSYFSFLLCHSMA